MTFRDPPFLYLGSVENKTHFVGLYSGRCKQGVQYVLSTG